MVVWHTMSGFVVDRTSSVSFEMMTPSFSPPRTSPKSLPTMAGLMSIAPTISTPF